MACDSCVVSKENPSVSGGPVPPDSHQSHSVFGQLSDKSDRHRDRDRTRAQRDGRVYQRSGHRCWWVDYHINGRRHRLSSRSTDRTVAEQLLEKIIRERKACSTQLEHERRTARRIFEQFTTLTLTELLTQSVRALASEMRGLDRPVPGVYFVRSGELIKIGFTNNLDTRMSGLQTGNISEIELLAMLHGPRSLERRLHSLFAEHRERGEWFRVNDRLTGFLKSWRAIYGADIDQKTPESAITVRVGG
jgi:hypothetical protein